MISGGRRMSFVNLTEIVQLTARRLPDHPAQRYWDGSEWIDRSYKELWEAIQSTARGLKTLGMNPGDRVGLMAKTRPEWVIADYAILLADLVTVPLYPSIPPEQISHIVEDAGITWLIVDDQSELTKLPPTVQGLYFDGDPQGSGAFGRLAVAGPPLKPERSRNDLATLVYTSGTTGNPKGVCLTHGNLLANVEAIAAIAQDNLDFSMTPTDVALAFLPLSHILERTGHNVLMWHGVTLAYARSTDQLPQDLLTIRPTLMIAVPRVFEKMYARIHEQARQAGAIKRMLFDAAVHAGCRRYHLLTAEKRLSSSLNTSMRLYDRLVFRQVRRALGGRLRFAIAGGAALSPDIGLFFFSVGIPVLEGYGLTETAPVIAVNRPPLPRYGTVGLPLSGIEVRVADDGEILVRGPSIFWGYWNLAEETQAVLKNGWFHTEDVGHLSPDGYLSVTGRKKQLIVLSTGKNVAPQLVEQKLLLSPWIEQAVVLGSGQKYVTALLYVEPGRLRAWAQKSGKQSLDTPLLLKDGDLMAILKAEVDRTTRNLASFERPKRFALLPEALSEERGELTPSLKVKVSVVEQRYAHLIEGTDPLPGLAQNLRREHRIGSALAALGAGALVALIIRLIVG